MAKRSDDYTWSECVLAGAIANIVKDWESGNLAERINEAQELVESIFGSIDECNFDALAEGYAEGTGLARWYLQSKGS